MAPFEDRISNLPDDVLNEILMCLPVDEAARTRTLAKRWMRVFEHLGGKVKIDLIDIGWAADDFVHRVLMFVDFKLRLLSLREPPPHRRNPHFDKFMLKCEVFHSELLIPMLENWVNTLFKLGVKKLDLLVEYHDRMLLSKWASVYPCENLVVLKIMGSFFEIPDYLPNLEILNIYVMEDAKGGAEGGGLSDRASNESFCKYPKLSTLTIRAGVPSDLNIVLPSLQKLKLHLKHFEENKVLIDAPMLDKLSISEEDKSESGNYLVRASSLLTEGSFSKHRELDSELEIFNIIELPSAIEITKAWLKEHRQLECLEFINCHSLIEIPFGIKIKLVFNICDEKKLHGLRSTLKDLQVLKVGTSKTLEEGSEEEGSEEQGSEEEDWEEEDLPEDNEDVFLRMEGKEASFFADKMWVEVLCRKCSS